MKTLILFTAITLAAGTVGAAEKQKPTSAPAKVKVVAHEKLQALLPELPGWKRGEIKGETVREDTAMSRVQVDYEKAESGLSFELMDTGKDRYLLAEMRQLSKPGYSEEIPKGYTKAITVRGLPAVEEWTEEARNGYVSVLVADRFVLKVTGSYVANVEVIRNALEAVDLNKLAALE